MKNKFFYLLFFLYALVFVFILYINGIFSGESTSLVNLLINVGFLVIIGILFVISAISFGRLNRCTDELAAITLRLPEEYKKAGGRSLWPEFNRKDVFENEALSEAFAKYRLRMKNFKTKRGYTGTCDIDEYINEDLLDRVGMNFYNSSIAGTMTGLGILGTFLGLSMGLGSFNGNDIYTISDNVGPLLSGMKVAFHTSVYGIFFSLVFTFIYRSLMADAYEKLENFQNAFRQYAMPAVSTQDENAAAMVVYQASMANATKQMLELMKGHAAEQSVGVERIVEQFTEQMTAALGVQFQKLGNTLKSVSDVQIASTDKSRELVEASAAMMAATRSMQEMLSSMQARQEAFARELNQQKEKLSATCDEMNNELSKQLFAYGQMKDLEQDQI